MSFFKNSYGIFLVFTTRQTLVVSRSCLPGPVGSVVLGAAHVRVALVREGEDARIADDRAAVRQAGGGGL